MRSRSVLSFVLLAACTPTSSSSDASIPTIDARAVDAAVPVDAPLVDAAPVVDAGPLPFDALPVGRWSEVAGSHLRDAAASAADFPWLAQGEGLSGIMNDWSGAAYDTHRDRLYVTGGGHNGYYGNEIYAFDLGTLRWSRLTDPGPVPEGAECPSPSSWCAIHTYDGLEYVPPPVDRVLLVGGWGARETFLFDPETNETTSLGESPFDDTARTSLFAATLNGRVYAGRGMLRELDPSLGTWSTWSTAFDNDVYWSGQYQLISDGERALYAVGGSGIAPFVLRLMPAAEAPFTAVETTGAPTEIVSNPHLAVDYDTHAHRIVAWLGGAALHALDPETGLWTQIAPEASDSVVPPAVGPNGTFGRFRYSPRLDAVLVVSSVDENVFVFRFGAS